MKNRKNRKNSSIFTPAFLVVLCLLLALSGCSSRKESNYADYAVMETTAAAMDGYAASAPAAHSLAMMPAPAEAAEYEYAAGNSYGNNSSSGSPQELYNNSTLPENRKLIRTVEISYESDRFEEFTGLIKAQVTAFGGYIESSGMGRYNNRKDAPRYANFTIRVPADKLEGFLAATEGEANVLNRSEYTEDVTLNYHDIESRKRALEIEQERLLELLEKADTMEAIIALEERLSDIRYELDNYNSSLRRYDNRVDYATVNISIKETTILTPAPESTPWEKIKTGFKQNLEDVIDGLTDFGIWFASSIPSLVVFAVIVLIVIAIFRALFFGKKRKERRAAKKAEKEAKKAEKAAKKAAEAARKAEEAKKPEEPEKPGE